MEDSNFRKGDAKTAIFGSEKMLQASPVDKIPDEPGDIRNYLYGRLCNQTYERGDQHQLYR